MVTGYFCLACGIYWIAFALVQKTTNLRSSIVYKVLPFLCGLATLVAAANSFGWISIK